VCYVKYNIATIFEVAADGRLSTSVGCNRMVGQPAVDGRRIGFELRR